MRKLTFFVLLACMMVGIFGCRVNQLITTPTQDITTYKASAEEVRASIIKACVILGWKAKDKDDHTLEASILVRNKHHVTVDIPYTSESYTIKYVSSQNMDDNHDGKIHPNYNNWVIRLSDTIDKDLAIRNLQ